MMIKNHIDFSDFDAIIKAEGLKCPVRCDKCIKLKYNSKFYPFSF